MKLRHILGLIVKSWKNQVYFYRVEVEGFVIAKDKPEARKRAVRELRKRLTAHDIDILEES